LATVWLAPIDVMSSPKVTSIQALSYLLIFPATE